MAFGAGDVMRMKLLAFFGSAIALAMPHAIGLAPFAIAAPAIGTDNKTAAVATAIAQPQQMLSDQDRKSLDQLIESRVNAQATNMVAISSSLAVALFGILITTTVIFFALRTKDAAVAEAKAGVDGFKKEAFEEFQKDAGELLRQIQSERENALKAMESLLSIATAHSNTITEISAESVAWAVEAAQRVAAHQELSEEDHHKLDMRSEQSQNKPREDWSAEDYFLLIAKHIGMKEWGKVRDLAAAMRLNVTDPEMRCAGYFYEGTALYYQGFSQNAVDLLTKAIDRYDGDERLKVRHQVAKARNNRIVALMALARHDEVIDQVPECLERLSKLQEEIAYDLRLKLFNNQGNALSRLGRDEEAVSMYEKVIVEISTIADGEKIHINRLAHAYYNRGCSLALLNRPYEAVNSLEKSRGIAVTEDTRGLAEDSDFNKIRETEVFIQFLARHNLGASGAEQGTPPGQSRPQDSAS